jgi:hypothetical protein
MTPPLGQRQRQVACQLADELASRLAVPPPPDPAAGRGPSSPRWRDQSLAKGAAGVAVLHGIRAQDAVGEAALVHPWLARATRENLSGGRGAGLWFGAPALAFTIATAAPDQYRNARARLDAAVTRLVNTRLEAADARIAAARRPSLSEFDLVRGLAGLGAHLLHRNPGGELLHRVLTYLVRLTKPVPANDRAGTTAPGWWTSDPPTRLAAHTFPGGHTDLGMAHGITGPLALLALAHRRGITVDGHTGAIARICRWLDTWRQTGPAGPWWPERIDLSELHAGRAIHQTGPARPSWCYGTPGVARALQLAGIALDEPARQQAAEHALLRCLADPTQLTRIIDPGLCHGWAGLLTTVACAAADACSGEVAAALPPVLDLVIAGHNQGGLTQRWRAAGLMEGRAGLALALHTAATVTTNSRWPRCLLVT